MNVAHILDELLYNPFRKNIGEHYIRWEDITKPLEKVKARHFVYCLMKQDEVIYIGRTRNLYVRLSQHKYRFSFDEIYLTEYNNYDDCCIAEQE